MPSIARPTLGAIGALLITGLAQAEPAVETAHLDEAKGIVKQFASQLQSELKTAMEEGGPIQAIRVCEQRAPAIADALSQSTGWEVGRTSLKTRNTRLNTPDDWETQVLESFETRKARGESIESIAQAEVVTTEGGQRFRFIKAIPTQELCLACHGSDISEPVSQALDEIYPGDQARGFNLGDIRGAFTLSKPL